MARTAPDILFGKSSEGPDDNQALKTTIRRPSTSSTRNPGVHQPARHEVLRPQPARFEVPETISRRPSAGDHQTARYKVRDAINQSETRSQETINPRRQSTSSIRSLEDHQQARYEVLETINQDDTPFRNQSGSSTSTPQRETGCLAARQTRTPLGLLRTFLLPIPSSCIRQTNQKWLELERQIRIQSEDLEIRRTGWERQHRVARHPLVTTALSQQPGDFVSRV